MEGGKRGREGRKGKGGEAKGREREGTPQGLVHTHPCSTS